MDDDTIRARQATPFVNTPQAAHYLGLSARFLERMRSSGDGPVFRRHGRYVFYHLDDLDAWSGMRAARRIRHD
jgi:predicted DNA-binding transcriptional regulator AlpA